MAFVGAGEAFVDVREVGVEYSDHLTLSFGSFLCSSKGQGRLSEDSLKILFLVPCTSTVQTINPACELKIIPTYEDYEYIQEGDIMIGGALTVNSYTVPFRYPHDGYLRMLCVDIFPEYYRQLVDLLIAIKQINQSPNFLLNLTLGYHIYDSCGDPRKAVRSVLQILSGTREPVPNYSCVGKRNIAGFIGDLSSENTVAIAQILNLYGYSQVSYGATDTVLSNRVSFPYFFRITQSDRGHYFVLSKLLKYFGWTWVGIIRLDDYGGEKEHQLLKSILSNDGICIDFTIKITSYILRNELEANIPYYMVYKRIIEESTASVIVLCGTVPSGVVEELIPLSDLFIKKTLIVSYNLASSLHFMDYAIEIFNGSLGITQMLLSSPYSPENTQVLKEFHPSKYPKDKLLEDIWMQYHSCLSKDPAKNKVYEQLYSATLYNCSGRELITNVRHFDNKFYSPRVPFAVDIMARALHNMQISLANRTTGKAKKEQNYRNQMHHYLKKVQYDFFDMNRTLSFEEDGELITQYKIQYVTFRSYKQMSLHIFGVCTPWAPPDKYLQFITKIGWKTKNNEVPASQCTDNCLPGFRKVPKPGAHSCCYNCVPCSNGEIANTSDSENCVHCPDMEWPNENRTQCIAKVEEFLSYTNDIISITFSAISILFFLITMLILILFITYWDSPIVRANNRSLSFLLLVSIKLSFLSVFLFLGRPVDITCMLRIITFGITFSIAVSSLLAKTIMVCVAFKATKPGSSWRKWLGVKLSNSVVLFCSSIQIIICMTWLAISPPFQELDIHTSPGTIIIQCNEGSAIGFYSVIGYMGLLAAVSFVLAFLARSLPDSFNEAKYITFSMLLFCSVWITMIPAYLSTKGKNTVCVEIFAILTSSAGLLACIFVPKCYVILIRPDLNTKTQLLGNKM
ncbi:vomeronasal type-2 receptor 26 [Xenopus tropicalis]|uniref:Vomeronasal type-2 receptor 26 n=1 Tax=Xenopus tropicalis TaxID=8364 RepID=A0A8J1IZK8_XENTR|nr:vomeronasal type-2 receptor 26 [Xenopus tropicalis]